MMTSNSKPLVPAGWSTFLDEDTGELLYVNEETKKTQSEPPRGTDLTTSEDSPPAYDEVEAEIMASQDVISPTTGGRENSSTRSVGSKLVTATTVVLNTIVERHRYVRLARSKAIAVLCGEEFEVVCHRRPKSGRYRCDTCCHKSRFHE